MKAEEVLRLAGDISEGADVDWGQLDGRVDSRQEAAVLFQLKTIADIAQFHRKQGEQGDLRWGHLQLVEKIGEGSFGEIYRAWDPSLERYVALKLLRKDAESGGRAQALAEGRLLARLRNPHIATVHGVDEHEGRLGIWMELIEGRTLQALLREQGAMGWREATAITLDLCTGLAAVHSAGLIHRDIKAQNVIREEGGRIVLVDFGLGRDLLTPWQTRDSAGTPQYMAPELFQGERASIQSDVYALGVLLYHLVTHSFPVVGPDYKSLAKAAAAGEMRPLRDLRPDLPDAFIQVVEKSLKTHPEERFQSIGQLEKALRLSFGEVQLTGSTGADAVPPSQPSLKEIGFPLQRTWLWVSGVAALLALIVVLGIRSWILAPPDEKTLAVLSFQNIGQDAESQILCDGILEILTSKLSMIEPLQDSLWVLSSTDVRESRVSSAREARAMLGATHVISGSVQREGEAVWMTLSLTETSTSKVLQSVQFEEPFRDLLQLGGKLVSEASRMLELELGQEASRALAVGQTQDPAAYQAYVEGQGYLSRYDIPTNIDLAIDLLQRSVDSDPTYTLAHTALAEAYLRKFQDTREPEWLDPAAQASERARQLNDQLAEVHVISGMIHTATGDYESAIAEFEKALDLDALNPEAHQQMARAYESLGRMEEAEEIYKKAIRLRPGLWTGYNQLGVFYFVNGRYSEALAAFNRVIEVASDNVRGYTNLGTVHYMDERYPEAEEALKKSIDLWPTAEAYNNLAAVYYFQESFADAAEMLENSLNLEDEIHNPWGNLGDAYHQIPGKEQESLKAYAVAIDLVQRDLAINPRDAWLKANLAVYLAKAGKPGALEHIREAVAQDSENGHIQFRAALTFEMLGEREAALGAIEKALQEGYPLLQIQKSPRLVRLRQDSRFQELVRQYTSNDEN